MQPLKNILVVDILISLSFIQALTAQENEPGSELRMEGQIVGLQDRCQLLLAFCTHIDERHTAGTDIPAEDVQGFLDRDRVNIREQCFYQRNDIRLSLRGTCNITIQESHDHVMHRLWNDMRGNRDDTLTTHRKERNNKSILTGIKDQIITAESYCLRYLIHVAFLYADDAGR